MKKDDLAVNNSNFVIDEATGLPVLSSIYPLVQENLIKNKEIGFLYFDIVEFRNILEEYGREKCNKLLEILGKALNQERGSILRKEDLVSIGSKGTDFFMIFLFSFPRHKNNFLISDLKIISYRVGQKLQNILAEKKIETGIDANIDFHSGYTIIVPDPNLSIERLLYEAQKEAALKCQLEEIMAQFVSNVSHELKTPLTSIKGYVETLIDGKLNDRETSLRFLEIVRDETDRLNRLINDLLDLSMIEARQVEMKYSPCNISKLVDNAVNAIYPVALQKEIKINKEYSGDIYEVICDPDRIRQVISNLLDNAIKYSMPGTKVTVRVERDEWDIKISVIDQGKGIAPKELDRVFDRFYRIDKDRAYAGGRGLGLAIAKHIIEGHGGTISVTSKLGSGSNFTFTIPTEEEALL